MLRYNINTGVRKIKTKTAVVISVVTLGVGGATFGLALPFAAHAASNPSACGSAHGAFANVNGNFGWLGELGGTPGHHDAMGQQPGATGYNNSHTDCQG